MYGFSRQSRSSQAPAAMLPGALLALCLLLAAGGAHAQVQPGGAIQLDADSFDIDRKNDRLLFSGVRISQGPLEISADTAVSSTLDFARSLWTFSGNVQIVNDGTRIDALEAELLFEDQSLREARVTGQPVRFESTVAATGNVTRGQASTIVYDFSNAVLRLDGDAWLSEGANEITGRTITYHLADQRVVAGSDTDTGGRVRITITPPADAASEADRQRLRDKLPENLPEQLPQVRPPS